MIAIGLFLLAVLQAEDEQWLKFTALILLAAMFHKSALIGIVVWPLSKIKVKNHIVHFLMLGALIVEIFIAPPLYKSLRHCLAAIIRSSLQEHTPVSYCML